MRVPSVVVVGAGLHGDSPAPAAGGAPGVLEPPSRPCWGPGMKPHSAGHSGSPGLADRGCATQRIQEHLEHPGSRVSLAHKWCHYLKTWGGSSWGSLVPSAERGSALMFHVGQCKGAPDLQQLYFPAAFSLDTLAAGWAVSGTGPPAPSLWVE